MSSRSLSIDSVSMSPSILQRSLLVDSLTWTLVGAVLLLGAQIIAPLLEVDINLLRTLGAGLALVSGIASVWFSRIDVQRRLVRTLGIVNVGAAILFVAALLSGALGVSGPLFWVLILAADVTMALGLYQLYALRRS